MSAHESDAYVLDRDGLIWRVVRDGGLATRADYAGITSIGMQFLEAMHGPLIHFTPEDVRAAFSRCTGQPGCPTCSSPALSAPSPEARS